MEQRRRECIRGQRCEWRRAIAGHVGAEVGIGNTTGALLPDQSTDKHKRLAGTGHGSITVTSPVGGFTRLNGVTVNSVVKGGGASATFSCNEPNRHVPRQPADHYVIPDAATTSKRMRDPYSSLHARRVRFPRVPL